MGTRARSYIIACIALAELAGGCGGPSNPAPVGPPDTVRRGQTGKFADVQPGPPGPLPSPAIPPQVFLNGKSPGAFFQYMGIPLIPMVVTENPADDEFWELEYRIALPAAGGGVSDTLQHDYILGARASCETMRDIGQRNGARQGRCLGPHYLKRTGPPEVVEQRRGYNPR